MLTHWGQVMHIRVGNVTIIGSDNGLAPTRHQAITWTNDRILLIRPLEANFNEILSEILTFSFKKIHLNMLSAKWRPFCLCLNVLTLLVLTGIFLGWSAVSNFSQISDSRWKFRLYLWRDESELNSLWPYNITSSNSLLPESTKPLSDWWLRHLLWNCPNMNVTGLHWWSVNIGSGNGLVPSGSNPLPEPILTQSFVAIWRH